MRLLGQGCWLRSHQQVLRTQVLLLQILKLLSSSGLLSESLGISGGAFLLPIMKWTIPHGECLSNYLRDPEIRDSDLKTVVVSALSGPALSTVQHLLLSPVVDSAALLRCFSLHAIAFRMATNYLLDSITRFRTKQCWSDYCQQLYILLSEVLQSKGISPAPSSLTSISTVKFL